MPKTTVKILRNVIHKANVLKKDSVHTLPDDEANRLIEGEHAEEHSPKLAKAAAQEPAQDDSPRGQLSRMKRPELVKAVEEWNKDNADKPQVTIAANASNKDIVEQLLTAANYSAPQS